MRFSIILPFCALLISSSVFAHHPNEGYFTISHTLENKIEVRAELPWTMRNALLIAHPELRKVKTPEAFSKYFKKYVENNLILYDDDKEKFQLEDIYEVDTHEHSHHSTFDFIYSSDDDLASIQNTIMFETSPKQKNYHLIEGNNQNYYITTPKKKSFEIPVSWVLKPYWFLLIGLIMGLLFFKERIKAFFQNYRS